MFGPAAMRGVIGIALLVIGIVVVYAVNRPRPKTVEKPVATTDANATKPERAGASRSAPAFDSDQPKLAVSAEATFEAPHFDLAKLDYESLRKRTPDSLYWLLAAPTEDPEALKARQVERERRNAQYGRVVSSAATVAEIEDYYAYRRRLSEDYIEVAQLILNDHGDELSERDVGLFELTIALHAARLSELPKKMDDALRRKSEYDRVKEVWQAQRHADSEARSPDTKGSPE